MATQVRPLAGGAWNGVTLANGGKQTSKGTTFGITVPGPQLGIACLALNAWINRGGVGPHAILAQKRAAAIKLQIQEV